MMHDMLEPQSLANDLMVDAEGRIADVALIAGKVEQKGRKIKIRTPRAAMDVGGGTISLSFNGDHATVRFNTGTEFEGDDGNGIFDKAAFES